MPVHYASYSGPLRWLLRSLDGLLAWRNWQRHAPSDRPPAASSRILLANQGHLGDAILATAAVAPLRRHFPDARLGFLVHPDSRKVVESLPGVEWVHVIEHWHLNRSARGAWRRLMQHRRTTRQAIESISGVGYQLAIDLHPYFPNSVPVLRRCGIPWLVGWNTGGFGRLLDIAVGDADGTPVNMLTRHARLMRALGAAADDGELQPAVALSDLARRRWQAMKSSHGIGSRFVALHIGAHSPHRRWPASQWADTAQRIAASNVGTVVLLGHGAAEVALTAQIHRACPATIDLGGRLDWNELLAAIADCAVLVSHDSAAAHLAAALDVQRICIATGIHDLRVWLRESQRSVVATNPVACAPCGRVGGCATMACIRGVAPAGVAAIAIEWASRGAAAAARSR